MNYRQDKTIANAIFGKMMKIIGSISKLFVPVAAGKIYPGHTVAHVFLANCADPVCLVYQTCLDDHNVADSVYDSVLDLK